MASGPDTPSEAASESVAILTTRLTSDHHLIATLSISGVMGADVAVFPNITNATASGKVVASDEVTSAGGNIYTVSNVPNTLDTGGSYAGSDGSSPISEDKPDSLLLNFENEEGVVESVRLWLDNEIDETVILDGISIPSDDTINTNSNGNDNGSSSNDSNFSSRVADGSNSNRSSQPDQPRLAVPLSDLSDLSSSSSSDLAAISDTVSDTKNISDTAPDTATAPSVLGYSLESFIGLDQISSPIIVVLPSTNEQYYFANGKALAAYDRFDQDYKILEVRATTRAEIEVRLVRK